LLIKSHETFKISHRFSRHSQYLLHSFRSRAPESYGCEKPNPVWHILPQPLFKNRNFPLPPLETFNEGTAAQAARIKVSNTKGEYDMYKRIQTTAALLGLTLGLAIVPAIAQSDSDSKMKSSKMATDDKMKSADKMSKEEKAAMFDKMSDKDKMEATKMAGHDMTKMSPKDRMAMTDKMSVDDKAMAYDKMKMSKMDKAAMDKAKQ
jgi:hypothetical protein